MINSNIHGAMALRLALLWLLVCTFVPAQDLVPKSRPEPHPVLLFDGKIHPVNGPSLEQGWVLIEAGRIAQMGAGDPPKIGGDVVHVDLDGRSLYPGFIGSYTQLGLEEISRIEPSTDMDELGSTNPEVRAVVAVNPDSTLIPVARLNGVLAAGIFRDVPSSCR